MPNAKLTLLKELFEERAVWLSKHVSTIAPRTEAQKMRRHANKVSNGMMAGGMKRIDT